MTAPGKPKQPPNLIADLQQMESVLPKEKLRSLQKTAESGVLDDETVMKTIGERGLLLIAFSLAVSNEPLLLNSIPRAYVENITRLSKHISESAPSLLNHPRVLTLARNFSEASTRDDEDAPLPFDDIDGIRAIPTYLDNGGPLTPLLRIEIALSNRSRFPALALRLVDVSFLVAALVGSMNQVLESNGRLADAGLLDVTELKGVRRYMPEIFEELDKLKSALESAHFQSSDQSQQLPTASNAVSS